jgi:N-acetyl-anhydromuramyl-L-alanine amidase AmpD
MIGYHYVIKTDGTVEPGRHPDSIGAHVEGHNAKSIGICLVGGVDAAGKSVNNFTPVQFQALTKLIAALQAKYPGVEIRGHRDFRGVKKDCPCYDVRAWAFAAGLLL